MTLNSHRLLASLVVFLSIIFLPYWLYLPILIVVAIVVPFYWEAIPFWFLTEALYGFSLSWWGVALLLFLIVLLPVRDKLRFEL